MNELTLRAAATPDLAAVLEFWRTAAENDSRPADTATAIGALIARDPGALILATAGNRIVGTIIAGWDGWRCHLYRLAVAPDHRRSGLGRRLIAAAEHRFRDLGGTRADAMVLDANEGAHRIWAATGYHRQDNWARWVKPLSSEDDAQPDSRPGSRGGQSA